MASSTRPTAGTGDVDAFTINILFNLGVIVILKMVLPDGAGPRATSRDCARIP